MKRKLFQTLMLVAAIGFLASCKKEHTEVVPVPDGVQNDAAHQPLAIPTLTPRLMRIKNANSPLDSFVYDPNGRVVKTFTRELPYGTPFTTTYTYGPGTIIIKRFNTAFPASVAFDFRGVVDSKGRLVRLDGNALNEEEEASDKYVPMTYTFAYDSYGHLSWWKRKTNTSSPSVRSTLFFWNNNNITSSYFYRGSTLAATTQYSYGPHPDNHGVWDVVKDRETSLRDFWVSDLFGGRSKNLCTKTFTTWQGSTGTHTATQSWTVQNGLPATSTLNDPEISNRPVYLNYLFQ